MTHYRGSRKAVDVRAGKLAKEYSDKARHIDTQYNGTTEDQVGPVEQKLKSYGDIKGLVVGQFADCSQDLHDLLLNFADEKVLNMGRSKGISIDQSTRSLIIQQYRRRFSVCAIKAQSVCLLTRLSHMMEGARAAAQRRADFRSWEEASKRDLISHFEANVRGRRLNKVGLLHSEI